MKSLEEKYEVDVLYEDNHLIVVNKRPGDIIQEDKSGDIALCQKVAAFIAERDSKPGAAFLGVVHRLDRPVSGVVLFAKTSKALTRMNEQFKNGVVKKRYWAIVSKRPPQEETMLVHYIRRDGEKNRSYAHSFSRSDAKEAKLIYRLLKSSDNYHLLEVELLTGRHHQIRCQLSAIGSPIKGDLKYGAARSNRDGSISLHAREISFDHPIKKERICVIAPVPIDPLWSFFSDN